MITMSNMFEFYTVISAICSGYCVYDFLSFYHLEKENAVKVLNGKDQDIYIIKLKRTLFGTEFYQTFYTYIHDKKENQTFFQTENSTLFSKNILSHPHTQLRFLHNEDDTKTYIHTPLKTEKTSLPNIYPIKLYHHTPQNPIYYIKNRHYTFGMDKQMLALRSTYRQRMPWSFTVLASTAIFTGIVADQWKEYYKKSCDRKDLSFYEYPPFHPKSIKNFTGLFSTKR